MQGDVRYLPILLLWLWLLKSSSDPPCPLSDGIVSPDISLGLSSVWDFGFCDNKRELFNTLHQSHNHKFYLNFFFFNILILKFSEVFMCEINIGLPREFEPCILNKKSSVMVPEICYSSHHTNTLKGQELSYFPPLRFYNWIFKPHFFTFLQMVFWISKDIK